MYVITPSPKFKQTVTFPELNENGTEVKYKYVAIFKRPDADQLKQIAKDVNTIDEATGDVKTSDLGLMKEWMVGWDGVRTLDEDNKEQPLEFDEFNMAENFRLHPTCLPATVNAFFDGAKGAKAKNS